MMSIKEDKYAIDDDSNDYAEGALNLKKTKTRTVYYIHQLDKDKPKFASNPRNEYE